LEKHEKSGNGLKKGGNVGNSSGGGGGFEKKTPKRATKERVSRREWGRR